MAKKERQGKKERPLEKMTAKELRELGLTMPEISGVHGMNKAELITAINQARGVVEEKKAGATDVREVKRQIKALKVQRGAALESGAEKQELDRLRRKIGRLKKRTRKAA